MYYKIKKLPNCLLMCLFLLYPIFLIGAEKHKFKYHPRFSVLEFYLIRLYDTKKCGAPKNFYNENISWCLKELPKLNKSNIELHFIIDEKSTLAKNIIKALSSERKQLILNSIDDFKNDYRKHIGIYFDSNINNQEIIEEDIIKLMGLYLHYCLGNKCYIKKDKFTFE